MDLLTHHAADSTDITIAAPYMKADALRQLLAPMQPDASLICVSRWTVSDVLSGASDVECRDIVLQAGGDFLLHPRLHAKYFRFSDTVYVGSANVTARALGLARTQNLEILWEPAATFDAAGFESELLAESIAVSDADMALWRGVASANSFTDISSRDLHALDRDWLPATREPEHVWLAYRGLLGPIDSADERRLAALDLAAIRPPGGMDRQSFDLWVAGRLLSSPLVDDVRRVSGTDDVDAWDELSERWDITRSDAVRVRATVENWIAAFLRP